MTYNKLQTILSLCQDAGVYLRQVSGKHLGLCPIHGEKTASFWIYPDGRYKCFGCQASGDAIDLYQAIHNVDFATAKKALGLWDDSKPSPKQVKQFPRTFETTDKKKAWNYCVETLIRVIDGKLIFMGQEHNTLDFWWSKVENLPEPEFIKHVSRVTFELSKRDRIGYELFHNEIERRTS